jgi:hypothetical protein
MLTLCDCNRSQQKLKLQWNSATSWITIVRTYNYNRWWLPSQLSLSCRRLWFHRATTMEISLSPLRCNRCGSASPRRRWWWHRPDDARFGRQVRHIDASSCTAPTGSWWRTKAISLVAVVGGSYRWRGGILAVTWWWRFMASSAEILMSTLDGGTLTVVVWSWRLGWETLGEGGGYK